MQRMSNHSLACYGQVGCNENVCFWRWNAVKYLEWPKEYSLAHGVDCLKHELPRVVLRWTKIEIDRLDVSLILISYVWYAAGLADQHAAVVSTYQTSDNLGGHFRSNKLLRLIAVAGCLKPDNMRYTGGLEPTTSQARHSGYTPL